VLAQKIVLILCTPSPTTFPGLRWFLQLRNDIPFLISHSHPTCPIIRVSIAVSLSQLSDRSGDALARLLSSPLCALREVVLAENFLSDCFIDVLSKDMRRLESVASSPLRSLDISSNKIRDR